AVRTMRVGDMTDRHRHWHCHGLRSAQLRYAPDGCRLFCHRALAGSDGLGRPPGLVGGQLPSDVKNSL
ncbi:MAG TPA: hypothetical protein PKY22_01785, partial [Accumulibacter sp.]|nr:hypothetical protein [Accumulibacter sp.]